MATPELLQDIELPSSITVLGQPVDLSPLKAALQPVESIAQGAVRQLAALLAQQPDLQFPISSRQAQTWLINTYLDEVRLSSFCLSTLAQIAPIHPPPPDRDAAQPPGQCGKRICPHEHFRFVQGVLYLFEIM